MDIAALSLVVAAIFVWGIISTRQAVISTPIFFVAVGLITWVGMYVTGYANHTPTNVPNPGAPTPSP